MSMVQTKTVEERFEERFIPEPNSGCWLWIGEIDAYGYGSLFLFKERVSRGNWRKIRIKVHRQSWKIHRGEIHSGMEVCHSCDMPGCVNPEHLYLGTHRQNMDDRDRKGRLAQGERSPFSKISAKDVVAIRASTQTLAVLGARYGIAFQTVSEIRLGLIWRSIK